MEFEIITDELIDIDTASKRAKISISTLYKRVRDGVIHPAKKENGMLYFYTSDVENLKKKQNEKY